jgi:hypothetical protein
MPADTVQNGAGTVLARAPKSQYIPEVLLADGGPYDGPYVQLEGYGGDSTITSMTVADSDTDWGGAIIYDGKPIEGYFTAVVPTVNDVLAYRKRA